MSQQLPPIQRIAPAFASPRVKDKVVIVTGANSPIGIGRASAYQFALGGARALYISDLNGSFLEAQKNELTAEFPGLEVHTGTFDCTEEDALKAVIDDAISRYGRLDVFFANAGISGNISWFDQLSGDEFMTVMKVNALSVFLAAKYASAALQKTSPEKPTPGGSIIATASSAGLHANAGPTHYSASKAAVVSLVQSIAFQLAGTGVRINALCPGLIETGMTSEVIESGRAGGPEAKLETLSPLQRAAHADEVARVCVFLGSDESSYVTGQAWAVCGGLTSGHPYLPGLPGAYKGLRTP